MASLRMRDIVKRFGETTTIHGVDLDVADGEFVVFVGPSGCGKSTLLRMISGLEDVSEGDVWIDDKRVNDVSAADRGLAMVFQSYALYPHMTVYDNMAFGLENIGTPRAQIDSKVQAAAKMLHLDALLTRRPTQLSGGQRQRVAIGRAIVREPSIFLFDEPLSNLDAELRVQMRTEITALHRRLGTTMIYVTHDQVEAMTMADRIVVLRGGRVEQVGAPLDLYNVPANRFVAGFIGSPRMNFLSGRVVDARPNALVVSLAGNDATFALRGDGVTVGEDVTVGVRPEHVALTVDGGDIALDAKVDMVEKLGAVCLTYCTVPSGERFTIQTPGQVAQRVGDRARVAFAPSHAHVFRQIEGEPVVSRTVD
jgi:multiple sugar transport system ATP-binding protein